MPLSGAERAKLYRQRKKENDREYQKYLEKERSRYQKRKEKGDIKLVSNMTEREKRITRKGWKVRKQKERQNNSTQQHLINIDTPPPTPTGPFPVRFVNPSRQRMRRDRAKAYREIDKLKKQLSDQKRKTEKYKKRLYRHSLKDKDVNSPRTKTKTLLKGQKVTTAVKRTILFHHVFIQGIKEKYHQSKSDKTKQLLAKALRGKLLKKYRMQRLAKHQLNLTQRRINQSDSSNLIYARKPRRSGLIQGMKTEIETFLCREDNSRLKAGKKSTKTKAKIKKQIHLMNDTLKNLHLKFLAENSTRKISYSLFCRLKPFHVIHARESDRETCLCKRHENLQFKVNKLKQLKIIQSSDLDDLAASITCHTDNIDCMYRTCKACPKKIVPLTEFEPGQMTHWNEWKSKRIEKQVTHGVEKGTETKMISVTAKELEKGTLQQLTDEFQIELSNCCKHLYNIRHQYKAIRQLKGSLTEEEVLIHVDFSENLSCKYHSEIQSMHFGASQRQISLHTGVIYTKEENTAFCSMSDNLKHAPAGIWGHMKPVLQLVKDKYPKAVNLFMLSDGPTTQYRCKENFYLLTKIPMKAGFKSVNWNFTEAGHGKGAPDGVGAVVKREADRAVSHGTDITNAQELFDTLSERNMAMKLFLVLDEDISNEEMELKSDVRPVPGTMKIHQVRITNGSKQYNIQIKSSEFCVMKDFCCQICGTHAFLYLKQT